MVKLVAFDLDGTIGDTIPFCIAAFKKAVEPYVRHELSENEIVQTFGLNEEGMIKQVAGRYWQEALAEFYLLYEQMHGMCPRPFQGIPELLKELKSEYSLPLALITGKGARSCSISLKQFGLESYFDSIETGSPEKNRKSEVIENLLRNYCLSPHEILYVGDTVSDVLSCRQAGVECLSATWAPGTAVAELEKINAPNIIPTVQALRERIIS